MRHSHWWVAQICRMTGFYNSYVGQWHGHPLSEKLRVIKQESHELLVYWIAFCIVHQKCKQSCVYIEKYGIALDWKRPKVILLSEQKAVDAMMNVTKSIRNWNLKNKLPLFHLNNQAPIFQYGIAVAQTTATYTTRQLREKDLKRINCRTLETSPKEEARS